MRGRTILCAVLLLAAAATVGAEVRWAAWPPSFYESAEVLLATSEPSPVRVEVRGPGLDAVFTVARSAPVRFPLPLQGRLAGEAGVRRAAAWRLSSEGNFTALLQTPATEGVPDSTLWTAHDAVRLPAEADLGAAYRALAWPAEDRCFGPSGGEPCSDSWLAAVAVRDGTVLRLDGSPCGAARQAGPLAAGDLFLLRCLGPGEDVTGVRVRSDTPFLLLSGSAAARLPAGGGSMDTLWSAPLPEEAWGTLHHVLPCPGDPFFAGEGDYVRVVGDPGTEVEVDAGALPGRWTLPGAGVLDLDGAAFGGRALRISSSAPVAVAQLMKSRSHRGTGDPALLALPPASAGVAAFSWPVPDGYGEGYHVGICAPLGAVVTLDGAGVSLSPLPGGTHGAAVVELPAPPRGGTGEHRLAGSGPVVAWVAGQGIFKSYAHTAGWTRPVRVLRGTAPDALSVVAVEPSAPWTDEEALAPGAPPRLFYRVDGASLLLVTLGAERALRLHY